MEPAVGVNGGVDLQIINVITRWFGSSARTLASPSCVLHAEDCADDEEEHARPQDEGDVGAREVVVRLDDGGGRLRGGSW